MLLKYTEKSMSLFSRSCTKFRSNSCFRRPEAASTTTITITGTSNIIRDKRNLKW